MSLRDSPKRRNLFHCQFVVVSLYRMNDVWCVLYVCVCVIGETACGFFNFHSFGSESDLEKNYDICRNSDGNTAPECHQTTINRRNEKLTSARAHHTHTDDVARAPLEIHMFDWDEFMRPAEFSIVILIIVITIAIASSIAAHNISFLIPFKRSDHSIHSLSGTRVYSDPIYTILCSAFVCFASCFHVAVTHCARAHTHAHKS